MSKEPLIPEQFQCPYCGVWATKVRFNKYHGKFCRKYSVQSPIMAEAVQEHSEMHQKLIDAITVYYNAHMDYVNNPSVSTVLALTSAIMQVNNYSRQIKMKLGTTRKKTRKAIKDEFRMRKKFKQERKEHLRNGNFDVDPDLTPPAS